jgi:hypothetical protein
MESTVEHWRIGEEFDDLLIGRLRIALTALGYSITESWDAVAGSQDVTYWKLAGCFGPLTIERETYMGVSVSGSTEAVHKLQEAFAALAVPVSQHNQWGINDLAAAHQSFPEIFTLSQVQIAF